MKTHTGGVGSVRVVLQDPGQAEVWHLTHQVAVDQDVPGRQVSVDVAQVGQVGHPSGDAPQQPHQLDDGELTIVSLQEEQKHVRREEEGEGGAAAEMGGAIGDFNQGEETVQIKELKRD